MTESTRPDYLLVGHLTKDDLSATGSDADAGVSAGLATRSEWRVGGTVFYAAITAHRLGYRVGIVTRHGPELDPLSELEGIAVHCVPSPTTTTFRFLSSDGQRHLRMTAQAGELSPSDVPSGWRECPLVQLAPVAGEVPPSMAAAFPQAWVGATAQGWLRESWVERQARSDRAEPDQENRAVGALGEDSSVSPQEKLAHRGRSGASSTAPVESLGDGDVIVTASAGADLESRVIIPLRNQVSPRISAVVLSEEDFSLDGDNSASPVAAEKLAGIVPLLVVTMGARGCDVYERGLLRHVAAFPAHEVDNTGAGDVFAAAFFIRFRETGDPIESARFASCVAALSVQGHGASAIPTRDRAVEVLRGSHAA